MKNRQLTKNEKLSAAIAITIGFGFRFALGNATRNTLIGLIITFPVGVALYLQKKQNQVVTT